MVHPSGDGDEQAPERIQGFRHWFGPLSPRRLSAGKSGGFMPFRFPDHTRNEFRETIVREILDEGIAHKLRLKIVQHKIQTLLELWRRNRDMLPIEHRDSPHPATLDPPRDRPYGPASALRCSAIWRPAKCDRRSGKR